jgi:hypothetical protein
MKLFVFDRVLKDYSHGMAVIAANDLQHAQQIAFDAFALEYLDELTIAEFLAGSGWGFGAAQGEYEVGDIEPGVKHVVYGGS